MKTKFLLVVGFLTAQNAFSQDLPGLVAPQSAAAVSDITALEINPAGLAFAPGFGLFYAHRNLKTWAGDDLYAFNLGPFGFEAADMNHFSLFNGTQTRTALALPMGHLGMGVRYSKINAKGSPYDAASFWDLGLICRWSRFLSFGAVAKNLNRPTILNGRVRQSYLGAVACRPIGERLTIGFDLEQSQKQRFDRGFYRLTGEFELKPGLRLFGNFDRTKTFGIGVQIGLGNAGLRSHNLWNRDGDYTSSVSSIYLSSRFLGELWPMPHKGVVVKLSGDFPEEPAFVFLRPAATSFLDLIQGLEQARKDPRVEGMVLKLGALEFGFARLQEVAAQINAFRATGRKVIAYLEETGNAQYYLASQADKVAMAPVATLNFVGLKSERTFIKGTLDKLGIQAEFVQHGKYKSAAEILTREEMSPPAREEANSLLDELFSQIVSTVASGRHLAADSVKKLVDLAPLISDDARKAGLIDTTLYPDQLQAYADSVFGRRLFWTSLKPYVHPPPSIPPWRPYPQVAVLTATGNIVEGPSGNDFLFGKTLGSETMEKTLERLSEDTNVKAIVLRIDSPGGTVEGSDLIWRAVQQAAPKKPLVVSMGDLAASGGYYITTPLKQDILASPGTITGSIGVLGGKLNLSGLHAKIGMKKEILSRGQNAGMQTSSRGFTPQEKEILQNQIDRAYEHFVTLVADGRRKSFEQIDSLAQGRVWTGSQALQRGLVDRSGGLADAIRLARQESGLPPKAKAEVAPYPARKFYFPFAAEDLIFSGRTTALVDGGKLRSGEALERYLFAPQTLELAGRPVLNAALLDGDAEILQAGLFPNDSPPKWFKLLTYPVRRTVREMVTNLLGRQEAF